MTALPAPSLPDRLRAHAHLHPESAELLREAADELQRTDDLLDAIVGPKWNGSAP